MFRILLYILIAVIVTALAYFAVTHLTGTLFLEFAGFDISVSYAVLLLGLVILVGICIFLDRLIRWFFDLPFISPYKRSNRRQAKSYAAINKGLVAVAAGNPKEALRQAKRAEKLSDSNSLTHLLAAQAALAGNDEKEAIARYTELLKDSETRLLGYRGLFSLHANNGNYTEALSIVKRAYELHPKSAWAFHTLFEIYLKTGNFDDALTLIDPGIKKQFFSLLKGRHYKAVLHTELARIKKLTNPQGDTSNTDMLNHYQKARKAEADFIPALMGMVEYYISQNQKSKARKLVEKIWKKFPRYDILPFWYQIQDKTDAESLYTAAKKLASLNENHEESQLLLAEYAIATEKWGDAEAILNALLKAHDSPQQRTLRLLCQLEERDDARRNPDKIREYMFEMTAARTWPHWVCSLSGVPAKEWQAISPAGKFDGLTWVESGHMQVNNALLLEEDTTPSLFLNATPQELSMPSVHDENTEESTKQDDEIKVEPIEATQKP